MQHDDRTTHRTLAPCPFCGNAPAPRPHTSGVGNETTYYIVCRACGARGGDRILRTLAREAWNQRV